MIMSLQLFQLNCFDKSFSFFFSSIFLLRIKGEESNRLYFQRIVYISVRKYYFFSHKYIFTFSVNNESNRLHFLRNASSIKYIYIGIFI